MRALSQQQTPRGCNDPCHAQRLFIPLFPDTALSSPVASVRRHAHSPYRYTRPLARYTLGFYSYFPCACMRLAMPCAYPFACASPPYHVVAPGACGERAQAYAPGVSLPKTPSKVCMCFLFLLSMPMHAPGHTLCISPLVPPFSPYHWHVVAPGPVASVRKYAHPWESVLVTL